jgi:predicted phosphodiesterase
MKIAIISDIHGHIHGFQAVLQDLDNWQPDHVLVAGDVVNRGPTPVACLEIVQERVERDGWQLVRGNHEDYVLNHTKPDAHRSGPMFEFLQSSYWTFNSLNGHIPYIGAMPFQREIVGPDGRIVRAVHASMLANNIGIYEWTTDEQLREMVEPAPAVLAVGHTHIPLIREIDDTLVINAGSVGLPFDGDRRVSYARLEWDDDKAGWQAQIVRLDFDYDQAEQDYYDTNYLEGAGPLAHLMLYEFKRAEGHLHRWMDKYVEIILKGEITMYDSVKWYMEANDMEFTR